MPIRLKGTIPTPGETDRRYYMIDVQEGNRRERLSSGTRDKVLALRKEQQVLDAIRDNPDVSKLELQELIRGRARAAAISAKQARGITLQEAAERTLSDPLVWARSSDLNTFRSRCKSLCEVLGATTALASINDETIRELRRSLIAIGNSGATINRKTAALRVILREAVLTSDIKRIPPMGKKEREAGSRKFYYTPEQEEAIFTALDAFDSEPGGPIGGMPRKRDAYRYRALFAVAIELGARIGDVLSLTWRGVRLDSRTVHVQDQKTKTNRVVPMTDLMHEVLTGCAKAHKAGPFGDLTYNRAQRLWSWARSHAGLDGIPGATIHALRHTCASRLLRATGNMKLVQEWLGHSNIQVTAETYAHLMDESKMDAAALISEMRASPRKTPASPNPSPTEPKEEVTD